MGMDNYAVSLTIPPPVHRGILCRSQVIGLSADHPFNPTVYLLELGPHGRRTQVSDAVCISALRVSVA